VGKPAQSFHPDQFLYIWAEIIIAMEYILLILVAFGAAMLTFFSGFGLGTILMPVFALFFPLEIAIALTAIVHLLNNIFKLGLIWRHIAWPTALWFALPAALGAIPGALLLNALRSDIALVHYTLGGKPYEITLISLIIGILLMFFAAVELNKGLSQFTFGRKALPFGGALSGFFGGLSGHQGALRSMFLIKAGLSKEGFIATGIVAAVVIDISRLSVYGLSFFKQYFENVSGSQSVIYVITACLAAFAGSYFGRKFLKKVTMRTVQLIVGVMILLMGVLISLGII
jgi:uncharacterized protein